MKLDAVKILSHGDLAVMLFACAVLSAALATIGVELYTKHRAAGAPPRPPLISHSTGTETIARIPTRLDGRDAVCTLRIDYKTRTWSLSC